MKNQVVKHMENESEVSRVMWEGVGFCIVLAGCYEGMEHGKETWKLRYGWG